MSEFDAHGGLKNRRLLKKAGGRLNIPSSRGVRYGYVAEVERSIPEGMASKRAARRIPALFEVRSGGEWRQVSGDISAGGALVLTGEPLTEDRVEVSIQLRDGGAWKVTAEVLRSELRGKRYAYHLRFVDPSQVAGLDAAVEKCLSAGLERLDTD